MTPEQSPERPQEARQAHLFAKSPHISQKAGKPRKCKLVGFLQYVPPIERLRKVFVHYPEGRIGRIR